ncbi:MAG: hypothetical protein A2898_04690 [Candidatus Kerfeldbacteria bacterium RIFCSPLOWO2_01_FULL_48_11]|uniref:Bacterial spore germination immunoglobulin-like domain-containing protein n=1 Tax=Candidatus Kerfeldbacteria bacterium RIFCSPLOWO2_01_FULL_48_11 TaxID=1798543 RepID=A0A1G2B1J7_9BACT|nr:MAG: hypothetical protein UY34_C0001G0142 [Parcubacteria group bacterium GW2011_GWA2_48_9]KKW16657.1 MAG: hypothetical protein UY52_C0002G0071 [Parcubacteria group bacterium GW2011_GWC2_49_9]OGY82855.1 MAG: hypothetical protein A2898_04690 [Candidatus Kerfeldbacteria bacterium RIFCSPLOWO2_01_FULL_48_11]HCJ52407.1 hypothetical protein [Candidatus Kerfeldbacteria bacterium]HCM68282.1 hypothetical protein [Candidatus Kerfeldbacteria bacterium]
MALSTSQTLKRILPVLLIVGIAIYVYVTVVGGDQEVPPNNQNVTTNTQNTNAANTNDVGGGAPVTSFDECVTAGYPVTESYPRQCSIPGQETFTEDIGNELEKQNLIRIDQPRPNEKICSPLAISGQAVGTWFFEATFPVVLLDAEGNEIASTVAQAKGDWMTTDFVQFESTLILPDGLSGSGTLLLKKDNPSGISSNDDLLRVPVNFVCLLM